MLQIPLCSSLKNMDFPSNYQLVLIIRALISRRPDPEQIRIPDPIGEIAVWDRDPDYEFRVLEFGDGIENFKPSGTEFRSALKIWINRDQD